MTDQEILKRLGLSEADAGDLTQKIASLNKAQVGALDGATTDRDDAAAALGPDCAPTDLQRFLDARKGKQPSTAQIYYTPQGDAD
jgi:hypothetical protein